MSAGSIWKERGLLLGLAVLLATATAGRAHFGVVLPSDDIVTQDDSRALKLRVMFIHPFEGHYMDMARPARFGVLVQGKKQDLLGTLVEEKVGGFSTWTAEYRIAFAALGIDPHKHKKLQLNLTVRKTAGNLWLMWEGTRAHSWQVDRAGIIELD